MKRKLLRNRGNGLWKRGFETALEVYHCQRVKDWYIPGKTSGGSGKAFLRSKNLWSEGERRKKRLVREPMLLAL
jgi:hypothetical protein